LHPLSAPDIKMSVLFTLQVAAFELHKRLVGCDRAQRAGIAG